VEQYVHSVLLLLKREKGLDLEKSTIGIVGVGHVGSRVKRMAESLGMKVLLNDPPRTEQGESGFVDLETIARECDVITFHTPLSREGKYATFHLVNDEFLLSLKRTPYIVNSSRGEVVDTDALLAALATGKVRDVVIDTWENEPDINQELLDAAFLATPHIAGYSADGKANATRMSLEALCRFFHIEAAFDIIPDKVDIHFSTDKEEAFLQAYNPKRDSEWLKESPQKFEWFRGNYPIRREI
jgi:erythronate-4-phosphate dehydrogenase